jgi:hypothetical protein
MTRRIPVVGLVLVLLGAVPATAQTDQQERLRGLTEVDVLIEGLPDASASCGITETGLTTAMNKALLDNGIRVDSFGLAPTLSVHVNAWYFEYFDLCVNNVRVELYSSVNATSRHSAQPVFGTFVLANSGGGMASSGRADHGQLIRDTVFDYVEEIAVDIRIVNQ